MADYFVLDIGGTAIKYGKVNDTGKLFACGELETQAFLGGQHIRELVLRLVEEALEGQPLAGVGIATAGMVNSDTGEILYASATIPAYQGINLKQAIEERFGLPCQVENDANCAGLAEAVAGAARGEASALVLTVGTGIGGCLLLEGQVYHGGSFAACEVGYLLQDGQPWEELGSTRALVQRVTAAKQATAGVWDGRNIFAAAQEGDQVCQREIDYLVEALAKGIANLCYTLNPGVVVLGGGIMAQQTYLGPRLKRALAKYLVSHVRQHTRLDFAAFGNQAGLLGAFFNLTKRSC